MTAALSPRLSRDDYCFSERRRAEELPAVTLQRIGEFAFGHRRKAALGPVLLLEQAARLGRGVQKQHPPGLGAGALPGMRHAARHEGVGAGTADRDLVADQEGDLAGEDIGDLVAVMVQMEGALGAGRNGFLEHHDAVAGGAAQQFERVGSARGGAAVRHQPFARLHDDALRHRPFLPLRRDQNAALRSSRDDLNAIARYFSATSLPSWPQRVWNEPSASRRRQGWRRNSRADPAAAGP